MSMATAVTPLGQKIRDRREREGWTQKQLALRADTSHQTVSRAERSLPNVSKLVVSRLAHALGSDPDDFLKKAA